MSETTRLVAKPGQTDIWVERWFDAPRQLVWEAFSKPELLRMWWGARDQKMTVCELDFRNGRGWRFVLHGPDGKDDAFHGKYKEIVPFARIVDTFVYEPYPDAEAQQITTFEEQNGRTKLVVHLVLKSVTARDGMVGSGMEKGMAETHARLDELLASQLTTSRAEAAAQMAADPRFS
jgi:uncharacterized protein YndB with AHSA1/START domain